jgi:hypothetical protein
MFWRLSLSSGKEVPSLWDPSDTASLLLDSLLMMAALSERPQREGNFSPADAGKASL